jgi:hypothetical protein
VRGEGIDTLTLLNVNPDIGRTVLSRYALLELKKTCGVFGMMSQIRVGTNYVLLAAERSYRVSSTMDFMDSIIGQHYCLNAQLAVNMYEAQQAPIETIGMRIGGYLVREVDRVMVRAPVRLSDGTPPRHSTRRMVPTPPPIQATYDDFVQSAKKEGRPLRVRKR